MSTTQVSHRFGSGVLSWTSMKQLCVLLLVMFLSACNVVKVAEDLSQRQAIEIVAALNANGIDAVAKRDSGGKVRYAVEVSQEFYAPAVALLKDRGLPRETEESLSELISQQGFIPNSREIEGLRLDRALALEIEQSLLGHPGIAVARAIVRQHSVEEGREPAVTVVIQGSGNSSVGQEQVASLVMRAVPGLRRENVMISLSQAVPEARIDPDGGVTNENGKVVRTTLVPFLFWWKIPAHDYSSLAIAALLALVIVCCFGVLLGYWYGYYQQSRQFFEVEGGEGSARVLKNDRVGRKDLPGV